MTEKHASDMEAVDQVTRDRIMTKRVLWKMDIHILPVLALLWLANFLDRSVTLIFICLP